MATLDELQAAYKQAERHAYELQEERDAFLAKMRPRQIAARDALVAAEKAFTDAQVAQYHVDNGSHPDSGSYGQGVREAYHSLLEGTA